MRRVIRHVLTSLSVLVLGAGCIPDAAATLPELRPTTTSPTTTSTTAASPSCCTEEQARYIEAKERERADAEMHQRIRDRFAGHPLRPVAGCESSREHRPDAEPVWDRYYHDEPNSRVSTASGGLQMLDDTFRRWVARYLPEYQARWARAAHAPDWFQMELGMRAYDEAGTTPWRSSSGCWG